MADSERGVTRVTLWARNNNTLQNQELFVDPATGELAVTATFTGALVVAIDEATDSIQIWGNDGQPIALFIPIAMGEFAPPQSMTKIPHM
jgi:hypothetical protein